MGMAMVAKAMAKARTNYICRMHINLETNSNQPNIAQSPLPINAYCLILPIAECLTVLPIACCLSPVACCAYCLLPIAHCLLPTAYCLLRIAYCLLPIAYGLAFLMFPWIFPSCYQPDAMSVAILSLGSLSSFCGLIWEPLLCLAQGCEKMFAQLASRDVGSSVSIFGGGCQPRAHSHVGPPGRPNLKPSKSRPGPPRKPPTRSTTVAIGVGLGSKSRKRPNRNRKRVRGITLAGHLAPKSQPPSRLGKRKAPPTTQAGTRGKNMSMMAAIGAVFGSNSVEVGNPPMKA